MPSDIEIARAATLKPIAQVAEKIVPTMCGVYVLGCISILVMFAGQIPALVEANPQAKLYSDPQTAAQLGADWQAVHAGDSFRLGHLTVRGVGGRHAVIHPEIPVIDNTSYVIGDADHPARFMHPGDALFAPGEPVDVLATPAAAPWMKVSEAVDYLRAVAPARAVPIHQGIIDPAARGIFYGRLAEMTDTDFQVLDEENGTQF